MFYQDNGEWKTNSKKISYVMAHTAYDNDDYPYTNNPKFQNVVVENVVLTAEQRARLEKVKALDTSIKDIEDYVVNGIVNENNERLAKVVEDATLRELVAMYVPAEELTKATVEVTEWKTANLSME